MTTQDDTWLAGAVRRKAAAELAKAIGGPGVPTVGSAPSDVLVIDGSADSDTAGVFFADEAGVAVEKALVALGWEGSCFAIGVGSGEGGLTAGALGLAIEAVDPDLILALDTVAAEAVAASLGVDSLNTGSPALVDGRMVLRVDDFRASLGDETRKRRVWRQLQKVRRDTRP